MALRAAVARSLFAVLLTAAAVPAVTSSALAQHVVTDDEAGKLTLDALTATPRALVHRVVYRPTRGGWAQASRYRSVHVVHEAAYRRFTSSVHPLARNRRRRT